MSEESPNNDTDKYIDPRVQYFDRHAESWDSDGSFPEDCLNRLEQIKDLLCFKAGEDVLEVGCGTGGTTQWLTKLVEPGRVTAIDFSPGMLIKAKLKNIDADFLCLDACSDDLGSNQFDVVFCFHCFPHLRNQLVALRSFAKALKPSGRLMIVHTAGSEEINAFHARIDGPVSGDHLPVGNEWLPLLAKTGFSQVNLIDEEDLFFLKAVPINK